MIFFLCWHLFSANNSSFSDPSALLPAPSVPSPRSSALQSETLSRSCKNKGQDPFEGTTHDWQQLVQRKLDIINRSLFPTYFLGEGSQLHFEVCNAWTSVPLKNPTRTTHRDGTSSIVCVSVWQIALSIYTSKPRQHKQLTPTTDRRLESARSESIPWSSCSGTYQPCPWTPNSQTAPAHDLICLLRGWGSAWSLMAARPRGYKQVQHPSDYKKPLIERLKTKRLETTTFGSVWLAVHAANMNSRTTGGNTTWPKNENCLKWSWLNFHHVESPPPHKSM